MKWASEHNISNNTFITLENTGVNIQADLAESKKKKKRRRKKIFTLSAPSSLTKSNVVSDDCTLKIGKLVTKCMQS